MDSPHEYQYFISRTDARLESIEDKLDSLTQFKSKSLAENRMIAFVISGVCGFVSLVASGILTYLITIKLSK